MEGKGEAEHREVAVFSFGTSPRWPKASLILNGGFWKQSCGNYQATKLHPFLTLITRQLLSHENFSWLSAHHCICQETEPDNILAS